MKSIDYLRKIEWSMGNGQCPECYGVSEKWLGHPMYLTGKRIGHKLNCPLANALVELGEEVVIIGSFKSDLEYESYISDDGLFGTRLKTKEGCPNLKKYNKEIKDNMWSALKADFKKQSKEE